MIFRPKTSAVITLIGLTAFVWGLGIVAIIEAPASFVGYVAVGIAVTVVTYIATEKVEIRNGRIAFFRYFRKTGEAEARLVRAFDAKVGTPALLNGIAFERKDGKRVGEIIASNYSAEAMANIKKALELR